ncbi:Response regulator protein TmoT [Maioricimonas rarisocia]|uniref:Response regulator protein TmoT n=1 Tax=Maioricimonas rarisocia TaxID=2528026 RepID=A0A517Z3E2_9PLAN|nr:response regulator [Maioricimonas rarisocia]QDU36993.1 Response regulator protein TmoT [Maioricimonas rarisocia]
MSNQDRKPAPTVFVVDDDPDMRDSLQMLIETLGYCVRVFESASSFNRFYDGDRSGCLVLDIRMPGQTGLELYEELLRSGRRLPVIFITAHADVSTAVAAMKTGAIEFLEKPFDGSRLLELLERAIRIDAQWREQRSRFDELDAKIQTLSRRDRETLEHILAGDSNKVIAARLDLTERAVEMRRARLMQKLEVTSTAELVDMAVTHRVLSDVQQASRHPAFLIPGI